MTDILDRPENTAHEPLFAETSRGVQAASRAFEDGRDGLDDAENARAWRAVLARNLL